MDIKIINELIDELKNSDTTYANIADLASAYIVRDRFTNGEKPKQTQIEKELSDILPAFQYYITAKRNYQLKSGTKEEMLEKMKFLCTEIFDFVAVLYRNTDTKEERQALTACITKMAKEI